MTRAELLDLLAVERHAPGPRPPRMVAYCDPPAPITAEQAEHNRQVLAEALGTDAKVIDFNERRAS